MTRPARPESERRPGPLVAVADGGTKDGPGSSILTGTGSEAAADARPQAGGAVSLSGAGGRARVGRQRSGLPAPSEARRLGVEAADADPRVGARAVVNHALAHRSCVINQA